MPIYEGTVVNEAPECMENSDFNEYSQLNKEDIFYNIKISDIENSLLYFYEPRIKIEGNIDRPLLIDDPIYGMCIIGMHVYQENELGVVCLFDEYKI